MSISIHSETSKDEIETDDAELEDLVWNLMSRTGLLSQIQGQISKFIENNGKSENVTIHPDRADGRILGCIFEYLQWVGMKQTNAVLLSEAPVEVDMTIFESRANGTDYKPEICRLFEEHNGTEDKASPTRSHNYSRDEFEDSRLTSASGHQSIKSDNSVEDEASSNGNESEADKSYSSHKQSRRKSIPLGNEGGKSVETDGGAGEQNDDMINFNSPAVGVRGFDQIRPNVSMRQRSEFDTRSDPFQSPISSTRTGIRNPFEAVPTVDRDNRLSFVHASNSLDEIQSEEGRNEGEAAVLEPHSHNSISNKEEQLKADEKSQSISQQESGKQSHKIEQNVDPKDIPPGSQDDEESTSDFMETLTMEEDTQDASIDSNTKGMSSCEHAVNLK